MFFGTWWSVVPPILAIVLALVTKEVYVSLFCGVLLGSALIAGFHPWNTFTVLVETMVNSVDMKIIIFDVLLGMLIALMARSGGSAAYGRWAATKIKSKKQAEATTALLGVLIFVDDYFNCLTVGSVMRPVTDKYKVSRAKLAYIIDATAAPVCILAPISSWAAAVNSYVPADSPVSGFQLFLSTIPFNLYALLTLFMVFYTSLRGIDFGLGQLVVGFAVDGFGCGECLLVGIDGFGGILAVAVAGNGSRGCALCGSDGGSEFLVVHEIVVVHLGASSVCVGLQLCGDCIECGLILSLGCRGASSVHHGAEGGDVLLEVFALKVAGFHLGEQRIGSFHGSIEGGAVEHDGGVLVCH